MKIIVIGIGQTLRGDDGVGLEAVHSWREKYPGTAQRVQVELTELPGLGLLTLLEHNDAAILVDGVQTLSPAGTLIHLGSEELASFTPDAQSAHGWGVAETLHLGVSVNPSLAKMRLRLIGISGKDFSLGSGVSPDVRKALPDVVDKIESEVLALFAEQILSDY